jgi:hypothetical protein
MTVSRKLATPTRLLQLPKLPRSFHSFDDDWSERPTTKRLGDDDRSADSTKEIVELSQADLESAPDAGAFYPTRWPTLDPIDPSELDEPNARTITPPAPDAVEEQAATARKSIDSLPLASSRPPARAASLRPGASRIFIPAIVGPLAVAAATCGVVFGLRGGDGKICPAREPRVAVDQRTPLAAGAVATALRVPSQGCLSSTGTRVIMRRALLGPGLDITPLDTGFGLGLAGATTEAVGLRLDGTGVRVAETLRVKTPSMVAHVAPLASGEDEAEGFDVRVDQSDLRTVVIEGGAKTVRLAAQDGAISALWDDAKGPRARFLWAVPTPRSATARSTPHGASPKPISEIVRGAARDDGGAVLALRRSTGLWLGVVDGTFAPAGPLVSLPRSGTLGTPAVAAWGGGGAVAWAERAPGERSFSIMAATFVPDGEGATQLGAVRTVGKGMSPALAPLPDGDLLLAYSDGVVGAHRVVTVRLDRSLVPRGEPVAVSPPSINAGQPALSVRPDGRALVAFFAAEKGHPTSVLATPLSCDPGL